MPSIINPNLQNGSNADALHVHTSASGLTDTNQPGGAKLLRVANHLRLTEAGRTFRFGSGADKYTAWLADANKAYLALLDGFPFTGADDMPADYTAHVDSIYMRVTSMTQLVVASVYSNGGVPTVRDSIDVSAQFADAWKSYDLSGHTGGGLAVRPGDVLAIYSTGTSGGRHAATTTANLNGVNVRHAPDFSGGVPTAGQPLGGSLTSGYGTTPVFYATVKNMPGFLWTATAAATFGSKYNLPQFPDDEEILYVAIRGLVVPNGETATISLLEHNTGTGAWTASNPVVFDMGATDQVTFGGNSVALNTGHTGTCTGGAYSGGQTVLTLNTGTAYSWFAAGTRYIQIAGVGTFAIAAYTDATHITVTGDASAASTSAWSLSEAGDAIDVLLAIEQNDAKIDVLWQNMRTGQSGYASHEGITTRSFANARAAAYDSQETLANPTKHWGITITRSGAATVGKIEYGRQPVMAGVSSWGCAKTSSTTLAVANHITDQLPTYLSPKRLLWLCGIYGGRFYSANANYGLRQRFGAADGAGNSLDPTPGIHDYRAIRHATVVVEGLPNDLTSITGQNYRAYLRKIRLDMESFLDLCLQVNIAPIIVSTLPRGYLTTTDVLIGTSSDARRLMNSMFEAICAKYAATFIDATVDGVTAANTPYEIATYEDPTNRGHLTTAGDQWLASKIAAAINNNAYTQTAYATA